MAEIFNEFFSWLKVHSLAYRMRYEAMSWEFDYGYIKACDVIKAELERLMEEHKDDSDRIRGD